MPLQVCFVSVQYSLVNIPKSDSASTLRHAFNNDYKLKGSMLFAKLTDTESVSAFKYLYTSTEGFVLGAFMPLRTKAVRYGPPAAAGGPQQA